MHAFANCISIQHLLPTNKLNYTNHLSDDHLIWKQAVNQLAEKMRQQLKKLAHTELAYQLTMYEHNLLAVCKISVETNTSIFLLLYGWKIELQTKIKWKQSKKQNTAKKK